MNSNFNRTALLLLGLLALSASVRVQNPVPGNNDNDAHSGYNPSAHSHSSSVMKWNMFASNLVAAKLLPGPQTYTLAITQIAIHDALNAIHPRYQPYEFTSSGSGASVPAAVAAAAHATLVRLVPEATATVEAEYDAALASIPDGAEKDTGIATGEAAAAAILARRISDNLLGAISKPYTPASAQPGVYQLTPPLNLVVLAGWGELPPFGLKKASQFPSAPPPPVNSFRYTLDYTEVMTLGSALSTTRTAGQSETAKFWYGVAAKEWNVAAQQALADVWADEWRAARTLAVLNISLADSVIASFDTKFKSNYWRPITAIRGADGDQNPATNADPNWEPLCTTPPFPEYNSTHAATGAAAATALALELGDRHTFTITNPTGARRCYQHFSVAAYEEGLSRIYCGIHFRGAMNAGFVQGRADCALRQQKPAAEARRLSPRRIARTRCRAGHKSQDSSATPGRAWSSHRRTAYRNEF
jgi:hypothetical protein